MNISPKSLLTFVGNYCLGKMAENDHKDNPLKMSFDRLEERQIEEAEEMLEAYMHWKQNPTPETAKALLREIADRINFLVFFAGKVAGFTKLER